jgi:hypothetical protein
LKGPRRHILVIIATLYRYEPQSQGPNENLVKRSPVIFTIQVFVSFVYLLQYAEVGMTRIALREGAITALVL